VGGWVMWRGAVGEELSKPFQAPCTALLHTNTLYMTPQHFSKRRQLLGQPAGQKGKRHFADCAEHHHFRRLGAHLQRRSL